MYEEYCTVKRGEMVVQVEDPWTSSGCTAVIAVGPGGVVCGRFAASGEIGLSRSGQRDSKGLSSFCGKLLSADDVWLISYCAEPVPQARPDSVTVSVSCAATGKPQPSYGEPCTVAVGNERELLLYGPVTS